MIRGLKGISRYIVGVRCTRALGAISSLALVGLLLMTIAPIYNVVDDIEAAPAGVPSELVFASGNMVASVDVAPTSSGSGGSFATSANNQKISFSISTNNATGYILKIKSNSSDGTLSDGKSNSINSLSSVLGTTDFSGDDTYNNKWGIIPNYYGSNMVRNTYFPAPSTTGVTLRQRTIANVSADNYTIGIGVRVNKDMPAGTYSYTNNGDTNSNDGSPATFILEYVARPVQYSLTFVDDVDHGATMPSAMSMSTLDNDFSQCYWDGMDQYCQNAAEVGTFRIPNTVLTATGRVFAGWCDEATTLDGTHCDGNMYAPGDDFSIGVDKTSIANSSFTLHAVWILERTVTVRIIGSVTRVTLRAGLGGSGGGPVTVDGGTVTLIDGASYSLSTSLSSGYSFVQYETTTGGTLGSATNSSTTYSVTQDTTLTVKVKRPGYLYDEVAVMSRGTQKVEDLAVAISTTNSGVYEYDSGVFGVASDYGENTAKIYYYRGILDSDLDGTISTYGSNGNGVTWPNYVKIDNTCWRIVRTTGDGGIKMIYNGPYSNGTNTNSCANSLAFTRYGSAFVYGKQGASQYSDTWNKNINRVGYTYNAAVDDDTNPNTTGTVFGDNSNYSTTNTEASNAKSRVQTFENSVTSGWGNILNVNASYCNDRSVYDTTDVNVALNTIVPYATSSGGAYFGAYIRNSRSSDIPSLTCQRGNVDIYATGNAGLGNGQGNITGLLTADEASFAGSGNSGTNNSAFHYNSFLRSGRPFLTMSPASRNSSGTTYVMYVTTGGQLYSNASVSSSSDYRPVIILKPDIVKTSGDGTASSPWVVTP